MVEGEPLHEGPKILIPENISGDNDLEKPFQEERISRKAIEKKVGWIDFDNPPEGVVLLGEPFPECITYGLMQNLSRREKKLR